MANQYKNKVVYNGTTLIDLSQDTVTSASHILKGYVGHLADGTQVTGTAESGGGEQVTETIVAEQTVTPESDYTRLTIIEPLVSGTKYIYTVNGVETTGIAFDYYGSVVLGNPSNYGDGTGMMLENVNNQIYLDTKLRTPFTVKVEKVVSEGSSSATLITKTITANGTYDATNDSADGYSSVTVNVENNIPTTWETKSDQGITITSDGTYNYAYWTYTEPLQENETYRITWGENGTEYICQTIATQNSSAYDGYYLGNASIVNIGENTGEPFVLYRNNATRIVVTTTQSTGSWRIKIEKQVPLFITKIITSNGTYLASEDNVSGYSEVVVNVSSGSSGLQIENVIPEQTINCTISIGQAYANLIQTYIETPITETYYLVTLDNIEYIARAYNINANLICIGDIRLQQGSEYVEFPFEIMKEDIFYLVVKTSGECTLKVDKILSW